MSSEQRLADYLGHIPEAIEYIGRCAAPGR